MNPRRGERHRGRGRPVEPGAGAVVARSKLQRLRAWMGARGRRPAGSPGRAGKGGHPVHPGHTVRAGEDSHQPAVGSAEHDRAAAGGQGRHRRPVPGAPPPEWSTKHCYTPVLQWDQLLACWWFYYSTSICIAGADGRIYEANRCPDCGRPQFCVPGSGWSCPEGHGFVEPNGPPENAAPAPALPLDTAPGGPGAAHIVAGALIVLIGVVLIRGAGSPAMCTKVFPDVMIRRGCSMIGLDARRPPGVLLEGLFQALCRAFPEDGEEP